MAYECEDTDTCPNLELSEIGDEKSITDDMLKRIRCAILFLEKMGFDLRDQTDPEVGMIFVPPLPDLNLSRGVVQDGNRFKFSNAITDGFIEDLEQDDRIDVELTKAAWVNGPNENDGCIQMHPTYVEKDILNPKCEGPWTKYSVNQYWYVGYNKYKSYVVTRAMRANPLGLSSIPSVARAQTFTAAATGSISRVSVKLHGTPRSQSPVYCELRTTNPTTGAPTTRVLGRVEFDFKNVSKGEMVGFEFKTPIPVTAGTKYAIVLRSPFTSYDNHFGLGGWGKNCKPDPCPGGYAWVSENNGYSWVKYGKDDSKLKYSEGNLAPMDFAYAIQYHTTTVQYSTAAQGEVVYFSPFKTGEITGVTVNPSVSTPAGTSIIWEVSDDMVNWTIVNAGNGWHVDFGAPYSHYLWVRATLKTTNAANTPKINSFQVTCNVLPAQDAYFRSKFYVPETGVILGASCWSKIKAPVTMEPNTSVMVDIVREMPVSEYVYADGTGTIFQLEMLPAAPLLYVVNHQDSDDDYVEFKEFRDYMIDYDTGELTFTSPPAAGWIRVMFYPCWIRGLSPDDFPLKVDLFTDVFTTATGRLDYDLRVNPVYPLREVWLGDDLLEQEVDYTVDPHAKVLSLMTDPGQNHQLRVKYTPYLPDSGIALAYRMTRDNTVNQAYVEPYEFTYRV